MFSNCIKYNTAAESIHYREEACRQRGRFRKLHSDAANRIVAHMNKELKAKQTGTNLNKDGAKSSISNEVVPVSTVRKRKQLSLKTAIHLQRKKQKIGPRCQVINNSHHRVTSSTPAKEISIGDLTIDSIEIGRKEVRL